MFHVGLLEKAAQTIELVNHLELELGSRRCHAQAVNVEL